MIRHAEAEGNIYRRAHGHFNGQVIGKGFAQIELLGERFLSENIDAVYSSDLSRTIATAKAISKAHGLPINATERLREVCMGEWEDIAWGDLIHRYPDMTGHFGHDPERWSVNGGEGYAHVKERLIDCISDLGRQHDGQSIALVSHGFAIRALICELMGIPSHETDLIPYCDNTAVALLLYDGSRLSIEYHGDNSHLDSETSTFAYQTWWREAVEREHEDLRYLPLDEKRDAELVELCSQEAGLMPLGNVYYASFLEDDPAGILSLDTEKGSKEGIGWVAGICMMPGFHSTQLQVQLLGQAVSEYRKQNRKKLRLEAMANTPLMTLCKQYRFKTIGHSESVSIMEKEIGLS